MDYIIYPLDNNPMLISPANDCHRIEGITGVIPVFKDYRAAANWYNSKAKEEIDLRAIRTITVS